jgi:hypothetical protein
MGTSYTGKNSLLFQFYAVRQPVSPLEAGRRRIKLNNHCYAKEGKDIGKYTGHF